MGFWACSLIGLNFCVNRSSTRAEFLEISSLGAHSAYSPSFHDTCLRVWHNLRICLLHRRAKFENETRMPTGMYVKAHNSSDDIYFWLMLERTRILVSLFAAASKAVHVGSSASSAGNAGKQRRVDGDE